MARSRYSRTPRELADRILARAPDQAWVRALVDDLDRRVRTSPLERLLELWGLSASEAARMFGVSRQGFAKWLRTGPPGGRAPAVADLAAATDVLDRHVRRERIPAVVRRPAASLGGRSLYQLACEGKHTEVREAVVRMFDLRRIQP